LDYEDVISGNILIGIVAVNPAKHSKTARFACAELGTKENERNQMR